MIKLKIFTIFLFAVFTFGLIVQGGIVNAQQDVPWGPAPRIENPLSSYVQPPSVLFPTSRAFGFDAYLGTLGPSKFFLNTPGTITNLAVQSSFFAGASWVPGPPGRWYYLTYSPVQFGYCDTTTGSNTIVGSPSVSGSPVALPWDPTTSTMYAITAAPSNLYTINMTTGAATLVAPLTGVVNIIDAAVANGGTLFGIELTGSGNLGKINKTTGVWTTVGLTGIIPFYAQGSAFDRSTGTYYWASYTQPGPGILRTIDTTTGSGSNIIGTFQNSAEVDGLAIPAIIPPPPCNYSWSPQVSGTTAGLLTVKAVSNFIGWAAGNTATVRRTTNGGINWIDANPNPGVINGAIYAIDAFDANTAWCTTSPGATFMYRTTNGGTNWTQVFTQAGGFIDDIKFNDANTGFAYGDPVGGRWSLWKSTNGGVAWDSTGLYLIDAGEAGWNNAMILIGNNIWFGTNNTRVYKSTNFGGSWTFGPTTGVVNSSSVHFNSLTLGLAGNYANGTVARTTDGGTTWTGVTSIPGTGTFGGLEGTGTDFWAVRGTGIYRSTNSGDNWTLSYTAAGALADIDFAIVNNCPQGWAVGATGVIVKMITDSLVAVGNNNNRIPNIYKLEQNFPNPFNPSTTISFALPKAGLVELKVYDVLGREIAILVNEVRQAGNYKIDFNASALASGVYFYLLKSGDFTDTKKMLLIK